MSPHPISVSPAWTAAGWTMLHLVWVGAAVGLVVALLRRALRRALPEIRHGVAIGCLAALAVAPVILFAGLYRPDTPAESAPSPASPVASNAGRAPSHSSALPVFDFRRRGVGSHPETLPLPISFRLESLVGYLPGVWLSGSLATLAFIVTGVLGAEQLRRSSRTLDAGPITLRCRGLAASLGVARRVGVAICDRLAAPVLVGVVRPVILLPPAALAGWSIEHVEMVLLHELAHIRRHDNLVMLLQRLVESLLFFHPVTWWLSAWVSLERELCCDRLVVRHTGRPQAYARMLAVLAGASLGAETLALAMARRPLTTRIRRILDMEDGAMNLTLTEGLGLLASAVIGTTMTLAIHAGPPKSVPDSAARRTLERLAQGVLALPETRREFEGKCQGLLEIARAQLKLGDSAAALATLRLLDGLGGRRPGKPGGKLDVRAWEHFGALAESAAVRRDAGDLEGARAALDRAARYLEIYDAGAIRRASERLDKEIDVAITSKKDDAPQRVSDEGEEAAFVWEASAELIDQCLNVGHTALARTLIRRVLQAVGPPEGPMKAVIVGTLGGYLIRAGEADGGHDLLERARQAVCALPNPEAREFALPGLAQALWEASDLDSALALVGEMTPRAQRRALEGILRRLSVDDRKVPWLDEAGIDSPIASSTAAMSNGLCTRLRRSSRPRLA